MGMGKAADRLSLMYLLGIATLLVPLSLYMHAPSDLLQGFSNSGGESHRTTLMLTEFLKTLRFKVHLCIILQHRVVQRDVSCSSFMLHTKQNKKKVFFMVEC